MVVSTLALKYSEGWSPYCATINYIIFCFQVASHPRVAITRDLLHSSICREDTRRIFLPVSETLFKKLTNVW
jgi:hypothetical protein